MYRCGVDMFVTCLSSFLELTNLAFDRPPEKPGSSQHYNFAKPAEDSPQYAQARRAAAMLAAGKASPASVEPLQPGNSGMWPFKVTTRERTYLLKVGAEDADAEVQAQAARARWAGLQGLGPTVEDAETPAGTYATQYLEGTVLTHEQAAGAMQPAIAQALRRVHTAQLPEAHARSFSDGSKNWLFDQDLLECLRGAKDPTTRIFADALHDLYLRAERKLGEANYRPAPVHDDVKADNLIAVGDHIVLIDWDNLKLSDPMVDVAHFLWSIDAPSSGAELFLADYYGTQTPSATERAETLARLHLRLFQVRMRSFAFFGQYGSDGPNVRFYRYLLQEDIRTVSPMLLP